MRQESCYDGTNGSHCMTGRSSDPRREPSR
jgi:hypothetical protein